MEALNVNVVSSQVITAGKQLLIFVYPLSGNQNINFSRISLSANKLPQYDRKQELSIQFASVLIQQQMGQ